MSNRWLELVGRCFAERQLVLRSGQRVRVLTLSSWTQAAALFGAVATLGAVGGLAGAYHHLHKAIHLKEAQISIAEHGPALASLREELAAADRQYFALAGELEDVRQQLQSAESDNDALRTEMDAAEARTAALDKTRLALESQLHAADRSLADKSGNVTQLSKELTNNRKQLREAELARTTLQKKLQQFQADSTSANGRMAALRRSLETKERDLQQLAGDRDRLRNEVEQQTALATAPPPEAAASGLSSYGGRLETLIASTGIDLDKLLGGIAAAPSGQGGPYVALDPRRLASDDQRRNQELKLLVKSLPLAAPLARYTIESGFGPRIDPINHRPSFHPGVDLSAPYLAPVLSTAPGIVTFTGVKPEYGRVVEITHAHGILTRYAHLHRILVAPGQKVGVHQIIGQLGSTGRSTGPHVHYEVRVDGVALDPAKFMEAGKSVIDISAK